MKRYVAPLEPGQKSLNPSPSAVWHVAGTDSLSTVCGKPIPAGLQPYWTGARRPSPLCALCCPKRGRWQDAFTVGQEVEAELQLAHGRRWGRCVVARKTASGYPVVSPIGVPGFQLAIDRKTDIRPAPPRAPAPSGYTVEAGRQIYYAGEPFLSVGREGKTEPSIADRATYLFADLLNRSGATPESILALPRRTS